MRRMLLTIILLIIVGCNEKIIGGERDKYGCLDAAGYSWNGSERECVREGSFDEDRYQVINFETCVMAKYSVMESYPRQCRTLSGRTFIEEIN